MENPYKRILKALVQARIDHLIVGGVAVNLHGYMRFTGDIDIVLALDEENLRKMDQLMKNLGYNPRLPVEVYELSDMKKLKTWIAEKNLKAYTYNFGKNPPLDIDIIIEESMNFKALNKNRSKINMWDIELPVISIDDLILMKRKANRSKDLIDLEALLQLKASS